MRSKSQNTDRKKVRTDVVLENVRLASLQLNMQRKFHDVINP